MHNRKTLLLVASAGLVYWVVRFFLLGTKARILGLTTQGDTVHTVAICTIKLNNSFHNQIVSDSKQSHSLKVGYMSRWMRETN